MKIAIAKDKAFNFTYRANIDALSRYGDISFFSPLYDADLPPCDMIYLPGGYPEMFADELAQNTSMQTSIKTLAEQGGKILAECGGFMYLCHDIDGTNMCNVLPFEATMSQARLHLGYRTLRCKDFELRGHEFHYSEIKPFTLSSSISIIGKQLNAKNIETNTQLFRYKNVIAGYTHWYWAECDILKLWSIDE